MNRTFRQTLHDRLFGGRTIPAIRFEGHWYSWRDLHAAWRSASEALDAAGVPTNASIVFIARTRVQHAAIILGAFAEGRELAMVYALLSPLAIAREILTLRAAAIIADSTDWTDEVIKAAHAAGSAGIAISSSAATGRVEVSVVPGLASAVGDGHRLVARADSVEVLSSGTTGDPKRIRLPLESFSRAVASVTLGGAIEVPEVKIVCNPFGNISGLMTLVAAAYQGQKIILLEKFVVAEFVAAISEYKIRSVGAAPPMIRQILEARVPRDALASLEFVFGGSGPLESETQGRFEREYGITVLWGYGATEFAGSVATWTPALRREFGNGKPGSVGRVLHGVKVRIVAHGTDDEVPPGEMGDLHAQIDLLGSEWIRSTDIASLDADGFLYLHGRRDGAINRGGFKILPERVVNVLRLHPGVRDAAVIGLPDPILGQVPAAVVERRPSVAEAPSVQELEKLVREHLPSHHVPKRMVFVDDLPRTPSMKVRLGDLARLFDGV